MPDLICLSIVAVAHPSHKMLGKKKLIECRKLMIKTDEYTYSCPDGHRRHYPFNKHLLKGMEKFYSPEDLLND